MKSLSPIGMFLRKRRIDWQLTLSDLGDQIGLSHSYLSEIETGKKPISFKNLGKLIKALQIEGPAKAELVELILDFAQEKE